MILFWILYIICYLPLLLILPIKTYGKKNFKKKENYVVVCNHQSAFDPIILDFKLKRRINFVAKKELWGKKEKSFILDNVLACIPVDRQKGLSIQKTKHIFSLLKDNKSVGIFPEGTRHKNDEFNENTQIKNGACLFAIKSKTPILPCFLIKRQKPFKKNVLLIGKSFDLSSFYEKKLDKDLLNDAGRILSNKLNELKVNYEKMIEEKFIIKSLKKNKNA